jgi:AbrB family looped-hinge helix DNA binding protein
MPGDAYATMTSKGQVTIPADIRERLDIKTGDQLRFHLTHSGKLSITPVRRRSIFERLDELKLPSIGRPVTKQDIAAAVEEEVMARAARSSISRRR